MLLKNIGGMVGNCGYCHINFNDKRGEVNSLPFSAISNGPHSSTTPLETAYA